MADAQLNDWVSPGAPPSAPSSVDDWASPPGAAPAAPSSPSFSQRLAADKTRIGDEAVKKSENPNLNDLGRAAIDAQTGLDYMWSYPKEGVVSAYNALPQETRDKVESAGNDVKNGIASAWRKLPQDTRDTISSDAGAAMNWVNQKIYEHPNISGVVGVAASVAPVRAGVKGIASLAGMTSDAVGGLEGLAKMHEEGGHSPVPGRWDTGNTATTQQYLQSDAQKGLFRTDLDAKTHLNDLYDWTQRQALGKTGLAESTKPTLDNLIDDARSKIANPQVEDSVVKKLSDIRSRIGQNGSMPLTDMLDLDKYYNNLLGSSRFADSPALNEARGALKDDLMQASRYHPNFGYAYNLSNGFYEDYARSFKNDVMSGIYHPDDTKNLDAFFRGKMGDVAPETQQRAQNMFANIAKKGPVGYTEIASKLHPDELDDFNEAFEDYVKKNYSDSKWDKFKNAVSLIKNPTPGKAINTVADFMEEKAPGKGDALLRAQQGEVPWDYGKHPSTFPDRLAQSKKNLQELKDWQQGGGGGFSPTGQRALPGPNRPLLSGPAGPDYTVNSIGEASPTDQAMRNEMANRAGNQNGWGAYVGDRGTPDPRSAPSFQNITNQNTILNDRNKNFPLSQVARNPQAAGIDKAMGDLHDLEQQFEDEAARKGYAAGGAVKVNRRPSESQKAAGNYKKHHIKFHGLDISIENPKGSVRRGESKDGKKWAATMPDHYGYIKRTIGADGSHVDCYVGENEKSKRVYVIDQKDPDTGNFDEHKVMLGYNSSDEAIAAYRAAFTDKKRRIMKVTRMTIDEFKAWLKNGNTKQPVEKEAR